MIAGWIKPEAGTTLVEPSVQESQEWGSRPGVTEPLP